LVGELGAAAQRVEVIDHGSFFTKRVGVTRQEAKRRLGLPPDEFTLLCIGFLQFSKGFDRAVEAVALLESNLEDLLGETAPAVQLHIVGSARVDSPEIETYVDDLRSMCHLCPVVPYREIWSSGVVERAGLYDVSVIASNLPQLVDQLPDDAHVCPSAGHMATAMAELIHNRQSGGEPLPPRPRSVDAPSANGATWIVDDHKPDRELVQKQILLRAEQNSVTAGPTPMRTRPKPDLSPLKELAALDHVPKPAATSARPGVGTVKQAVQRLTAWQIDPVAQHVT